MDSVPIETATSLNSEILQITPPETTLTLANQSNIRIPKEAIRTSLKASTVDSVFAAVYSLGTGGILLSNFLVELDASPIVFGMLSSIPMLVNLIQPLGAYLSELTTSRFRYSMCIFGTARFLWLILFIGVILFTRGNVDSQQLEVLTLSILLITNLLGGLGSASWLSWLAMIVPRRLRGRYFGLRNSAASLTNLICVPLAGLLVSHWYGGTIQGYGVVLLISILFGFLSLGCQYFKIDVNPQLQHEVVQYPQKNEVSNTSASTLQLTIIPPQPESITIWKNSNFLMFLVYFGLWMLAVNISAPFFNLYMLDTLNLDVSWVTIYGSLLAGANLLMLILWGKLADKIGNRRILIYIGILVALTPLLWLGIGINTLDIWLWLPLLHILLGGTAAAIDLCNNNMQLGIAPLRNQSIYFAIASAVAGVSGAVGTTIGSFITQFTQYGGLLAVFVLSTALRLLALIPLFFIQEPGK
ncbi:Major facilitator superfamily MFS_1 [Trichormus variabilis ATCC 29413]|uniref:Major facilitator superfamily MFS_1 n=2 Tax=Anabaena variabilis TaxID=264691 RepID=Q3MGS6_TRIV2|nr:MULTISPECIES: MFS transporter [Nostocaceae]ABA19810.1 Major facilitator superfamily MFS_1 [Trichormus variabilis ATCC 29413]MBC1216299.1 MFS transporter [Trichormus variabilis ARAD]MBC1255872.1 MFS transporter [Trichormus variabilis V5]MBC1269040.1 MFS transporter [Trichormus variabilis FSR]MBC1302518.1 MFS transporter [Trichormus variabilis N2B]